MFCCVQHAGLQQEHQSLAPLQPTLPVLTAPEVVHYAAPAQHSGSIEQNVQCGSYSCTCQLDWGKCLDAAHFSFIFLLTVPAGRFGVADGVSAVNMHTVPVQQSTCKAARIFF